MRKPQDVDVLMLTVAAVISCGTLEVALSSAHTKLQRVAHFVLNTMNRYLPYALQYQMNLLTGQNSFVPHSGRNGLYQNSMSLFNLPAHLQLQAPMSHLGKVQLNLLQQQFIRNYAFNNSEYYHQGPFEDQKVNFKAQSNPDLCQEIKQEILQKLNCGAGGRGGGSGGGSGATSDESRESSPDITNTVTLADILESRGIK